MPRDQYCDKMDEVKAVADILQDALKKIQTVAGSTTNSSVSTLPTGSSVQNSASSPSFGHNISNTPPSTAQDINTNPSPQLASQQLLNRAQANFRKAFIDSLLIYKSC